MLKNEKANNVTMALDIVADTITYVSILYILDCCFLAFHTSIISVFFFAITISVLRKCWKDLNKAIENKKILIIVFVLNIFIPEAFILLFGALEIIPVLK